ncbi:thiol-disulfide oxidoreductase DCC family protein [Bacillus weihaiensis]|uniref:thiol-disulfide oxidoreductase DCC family protein n=1 Tax=Bacillus weihaiensis TaxID=1547283 RepID=UPI002355210D|nr:DUF393 domain-containing protein [Bacillus weihaiensis]
MNKLLVFYDSWCPLCVGVKENIQKFDWFKNVSFISIRDSLDIDISVEKLSKEMHAINKNGNVFVGIDAIAEISFRIPIYFPIWLPLKIISKFKFGHKIYKYIANNRKIVPVNHCNDKCSINSSN